MMNRQISVLLVEDDFLIRACLAEYLEECNVTVLEAESCAEAMRYLTSMCGLDAMITDISLPDGNGKALSHEARTLWPDLPVIFTSGHGASLTCLGDALRPRDRVISKPYPMVHVFDALKAVAADRNAH